MHGVGEAAAAAATTVMVTQLHAQHDVAFGNVIIVTLVGAGYLVNHAVNCTKDDTKANAS